jgi:hypothetical protein
MPHKLYRVVDFAITGRYIVWTKFNDGVERTINFEPVLHGEVFGRLRDLTYFNQVRLDEQARTLVWPNGADFDPETLHNWDEKEMAELGRRWAAVAASQIFA